MKIAIFTPGVFPVPASQGGAVENLIQHLIEQNEVSDCGVDIELISIYDDVAEEYSKKYRKTKCIFIKSNTFIKYLDSMILFFFKNILKRKRIMPYKNVLKRFLYLFRARRLLSTQKYDKLILENHPSLYLALSNRNMKKYQGNVYLHLHNDFNFDFRCRNKILKTTEIICISDYIRKSFWNSYPEYKGKFSILYNCINTNNFSYKLYNDKQKESKKKLGLKNDQTVVLFSGRLTKEKGILAVLDAFSKVKTANLKLLIVGGYYYNTGMESSYSTEMQDLIALKEKDIIFTGYIDYYDMPGIYAAADFTILPSLWEEPAGLTILESMAMGLPVITTISGGIPEYIGPNCGFLLERDERLVDNIAYYMDLLNTDVQLRNKMSVNCIEHIRNYNIETYYKNFIDILMKVGD
jgi:Glycosyltransferase